MAWHVDYLELNNQGLSEDGKKSRPLMWGLCKGMLATMVTFGCDSDEWILVVWIMGCAVDFDFVEWLGLSKEHVLGGGLGLDWSLLRLGIHNFELRIWV